jgi:hypothetical protein
MRKRRTHEHGFVALMSMLLICAVLLVVVFTLYVSSFFARFDALDREHKRASTELAEACVNAAMLHVAEDPHYAPAARGECISVGGVCGTADQMTCKICGVTYSGKSAIAEARAAVDGAYSNLRVTFAIVSGNAVISDWQEVPGGDPACVIP